MTLKTAKPPYPETLRTLGDHVRKRRLNLGLRQRDVGALVGAAKPTVGGWEIRHVTPAARFGPKIVDFLGYVPTATPSPSELVKHLMAVRRRLRLARSEVAEVLGLSYATLWAWETGRRRPRGRSLIFLREFLAAREEPAESP